jgi:hypothetical protein
MQISFHATISPQSITTAGRIHGRTRAASKKLTPLRRAPRDDKSTASAESSSICEKAQRQGEAQAANPVAVPLAGTQLQFHPLANGFPMMPDEELNDFADDMLKQGQREPIRSYEGKILDGRNRYRACLLKGIEPWIEEYSGIDPLGFVISMNLQRRHLDTSERAMVSANIANLPRGVSSANWRIIREARSCSKDHERQR